MTIRLRSFLVLAFAVTCGCSKKTSDSSTGIPHHDGQPRVSLSALASSQPDDLEVNWDAALSAAAICNASYLPGAAEKKSLRQLGFTFVRPFEHESLHAVVCSSSQLVVVAFRGTDELSDWTVNADLRSTSVAHGKIHRGFHEATIALYADISKTIEEQGGEAKPVCVMGHSLGGAMAVAFACEATSKEDLEVHALITFGQPLLLGRDLAEHVNNVLGSRYSRYVNGRDIVTRLLPKFHHAGQRIHLHDNEFEVRAPDVSYRDIGVGTVVPEDPEALTEEEFEDLKVDIQDSAPSIGTGDGSVVARGDAPWLRDHSMDLYEARIRGLGG